MTVAKSKVLTVNGTNVDSKSTEDGDRKIRVLNVDATPDNQLQVEGSAPRGNAPVACSLITSYTGTDFDGAPAYKTQTEVAISRADATWTVVFTAGDDGVHLITSHGDAPGTNDYLEVTVSPPKPPHHISRRFKPLLKVNPIAAAAPAAVTVMGTVTYPNNPVTCQATPVNTTEGTSRLQAGMMKAMASSSASNVTFNAAGTSWTATNFQPALISGTAYIFEASAANEGTVSQSFTPS